MGLYSDKWRKALNMSPASGQVPVPGGPVRKTRGRDLCSSAIWEGVRTRHASLPPSSATASPLVRTSARGGMLQWTLIVVAGPTNLDNEGQLTKQQFPFNPLRMKSRHKADLGSGRFG